MYLCLVPVLEHIFHLRKSTFSLSSNLEVLEVYFLYFFFCSAAPQEFHKKIIEMDEKKERDFEAATIDQEEVASRPSQVRQKVSIYTCI